MSKVDIKRLDSVTKNDTTATEQINDNFQALQTAIENTVSRDGTVPNYMDADLDLNSYRIINAGDPVGERDVVTLKYFEEKAGGAIEAAAEAKASASKAASSAQSALVASNNAIGQLAQAEGLLIAAEGQLEETKQYIDAAKSDIDSTVAQAKTDITNTADNAINEITSTKDAAINAVEDAKIEIDSTKNTAIGTINSTVSTAKSDINTAVDEATMDISNTSTAAINTINTAVSAAESNVSTIVSDAEGSITNIAVTEANKAIANAAQEATDTAKANVNSYVDSTVKPSLQTYVDQAQEDANSAATSMEQAALSATAASNYASNASADADNAAESAALASADAGRAANSAELAQQIKDSLGSVYIYKGSVNSYSDLPSNAAVGDTYNVVSNGKNYAWTGSSWDDLGGTVDLSEYQKTADADSKYATKTSLNSLQNSKQDISNLSQTIDNSTTKYPSNNAVKTAIDAKQATITGGASSITNTDLTASRALVSNGSGKVAVSSVTDTELGYLSGVTSNIQAQLNGKASSGAINWIPNYSAKATVSLPYTTPSNGFFSFRCRGGSSGGNILFAGETVFQGDGGAAATFTWVYPVKKGVQITKSGNQSSTYAFIPCS